MTAHPNVGSGSRRRFNGSERVALYLAANGCCARCGMELEKGWHADHMTPFVAGGPTDVINGQALCPTCNLQKGSEMDLIMRPWQLEAMADYDSKGQQDYLLEATPGAGKTRVAAAIALRLKARGLIDQVAVVVPTDALRLQWADTDGLRLRPYDGDSIIVKRGYDGVVVTYAQLAGSTSSLLRRAMGKHTFLGIFDEIHHAGDGRTWCDGLKEAFDHATRRLALTGTPWRGDNRPIPFVTYGNDDGSVQPDFHYRYGAAVSDQVCRPGVFHAYDGEARWVDCGQIVETRVDADLDEDLVGATLDILYNPTQTWIPSLLRKADDALVELRKEIPDAGGLVVAQQKWQAEAYAKILQEITGEVPALVISEGTDNGEAKTKLDVFRKGTSRWLVAVKMVSEGIDIPRLSVGVYAAKTTTPLFFRQVFGRLIRIRPGEEHNAELFMPAVPVFMRLALEIEQELLHELELAEEQLRQSRKHAEAQQQTFDLKIALSTSEPIFDRSIHRGFGYEQDDTEAARAKCRLYGLPTNYAANVAHLLRAELPQVIGATVTTAPPPTAVPQHQLERHLRQEVDKLTRQLDGKRAWDKGEANRQLLRAGYPSRKKCSIDQLQEVRETLARWLSSDG